MIKTKYRTTADNLAVYDLSPQAAELWVVAGPDGHTGEIDTDSLPEGFRWVTGEEWEALQDSIKEGLTVFTYEYMGRIPNYGSEVAQAVCYALEMSNSKEGKVTELIARKAAELLNDATISRCWDSDCVLAVVENCSFTAMN